MKLFLLVIICVLSSLTRAQQEDAIPTLQIGGKGTARQFSVNIPELKQTQYQSFHDDGQYSFGYAFPEQMRTESRSADGQITGSYFYRDPNGNSNQVQYRADKAGFKVTANNLPVFTAQPIEDTPEVAEAKQKHLQAWEAIANHNRAQQEGIVVESPAVAEVHVPKEEVKPIVAAEESKPPVRIEEEYVAPLDLEPHPVAQAFVAPIRPAAPPADSDKLLLLDTDSIVDEEKEAVITGDMTANPAPQESDSSAIEIDADPIKLLAQLYAKHIQHHSEAPESIPRPEGFHPHISEPANGFDLFSRAVSDDRDAIELINPEYVDLRTFLLTNRFRDVDNQGSQQPQQLTEVVDKMETSPSSSVEHDLQTSDAEPDPYDQSSSHLYYPSHLYNQYFNLPPNRPVYITRETLKDLPESLKLAVLGMNGVDGQHDAQVSPAQQQKTKEYPKSGHIFSPYSSYYSPYYFYNQQRWFNNPYYVNLYDNYRMKAPYPYYYNPYYYY